MSFCSLFFAAAASAATLDENSTFATRVTARDVWHVDWLSNDSDAASVTSAVPIVIHPAFTQGDTQQPVHAVAVEHSGAYQTRAKIHRYASYATLPLFATELALGASIYNGDRGWKKSAHAAVGSAIVGLFAVNTVTGVWNLFGESWNDKGRGLRLVHGLLMLAADAGFAATAMSTPSEHRGLSFVADRNTHRNLALTSIGLGTTGYLVMLFGNH